ncbi:hypothetical protein I7X13_04620 [Hymenobacter sp. BT442]|uniref:DUF2244 domain-containing protein n=2 Tax=Hymenobacter negativus TaxID=2795026 RepID=A0ABS0Q3T3_9BACT|nr:hypothetical protein [Hymenobacter negativus]
MLVAKSSANYSRRYSLVIIVMYLIIITANQFPSNKYPARFNIESLSILACITFLVAYYWKKRVESVSVEDDEIKVKSVSWLGPRIRTFKLSDTSGRLVEEINETESCYVLQLFRLGKMEYSISTANGFKKKKLIRLANALSTMVK